MEGVVIIIIHIERCDNNRIIDSHKVNESIISILCKNILASTNTFIEDSRVVIVKFYLFTLRSLKGIIVSSNTSSHEDNLQSDTRHLCIRRTIVIGRSINDLEQGRSHDSIDIEVILIDDSRNCNNYFNKIFITLIFNVVFNHKKSDSRGIEINIFIGIIALLRFCFILSKILVVVVKSSIDLIKIIYNSKRIHFNSEIFAFSFARQNHFHQLIHDFVFTSFKEFRIEFITTLAYKTRYHLTLILRYHN